MHYIKKICEDRLRSVDRDVRCPDQRFPSFVDRDDLVSEEDEDEEELDSRNCTIDDDQNESIIMHPRVVLPQTLTKKRLLNSDDDPDFEKTISPSKRLRFDNSHSIVNNIDLNTLDLNSLSISSSDQSIVSASYYSNDV